SDGSIAIAMRTTGGTMMLRATRETPGSDATGYDAWNDGLRRAIAETALNAGHAPADIGRFVAAAESSVERHGDSILVLDPGIAELLRAQIDCEVASASDASWWRTWAVPIAAAIVATGRLSDLASLKRIAQHQKPSLLQRVVARYSDPARALLVAGAAVLVIGVFPIASAWTRAKVLEAKMPTKAGTFEKQQRDVEQRIALYGEIAKRAVPMSKVLGDLACCTPDGIEVEVVQLSATQGLTLRGVAKAQGETGAEEMVRTMASLMDASGVFSNTLWRFGVPDGRGLFKFDLEAKVVRATAPARIESDRDWAVKTLSERKYGKPGEKSGTGATASAVPPSAPAGSTPDGGERTAVASASGTAAPDAERRERPRPSAGSSAGSSSSEASAASGRGIGRRETTTAPAGEAGDPVAGGDGAAAGDGSMPTGPVRASSGSGAGGGPGAAASKNLVIPEPISDDELKSMTKEQLRGRLGEIAKARNRDDIEPDVKARLNDDFKRILDQLKALTP
ncbi:MAG: hypothetical protein ACKO0W_01285, partial [Planctomycetota bacterium]